MQSQPGDINAYLADQNYNLGIEELTIGDYLKAYQSLRYFLEADQNNADAWIKLGIACQKLGRYNEAIMANNNAQAVISGNPLKAFIYEEALKLFNQAAKCYKDGDLEGTIAAFDKALEVDPNFHYAWNGLGATLCDLGRYEEAIATFQKALEIAPNGQIIWYNLGKALNNLERYEEAIAVYQKALEIAPNFHIVWYDLGHTLADLERYEEAITAYDKALEINPNNHYAWNGRGATLKNLGRYEEGLAAFDKALNIDPNFNLACYNRGAILHGLERYEEAIAAFYKILEISPNFDHGWNGLGNALNGLENYEEAIAAFDKALNIDPKFHHAWSGRGNALYGLGRYEEAIAAYDKTLEIDCKFHQAWNGRGNALKDLGYYEEAIAAFDKTLERYEEAIADFDKALEIKNDQYWEAWANRGWSFFYSGRYLEAIQNWDEGLEKYQPSNRDYRLACGRLHQTKGKAYYRYGKHIATDLKFCHKKAKASYEQACQFLKLPLIPEAYLEALQDLIIVCHSLGDSKTNEYLDEATTLLENLILADDTHPEKKLRLTRKFAGIYQLAVDKLVKSGDKVKAIETAEKRKNSCLKWMQQGWQQPPESPNFSQMQELLKNDSQTAIIYWHLSPVSLTTFIIRHERNIQIIATRLYPFSFFPGQSQSLGKWLQDWRSQYEDYRKTKEKSAIVGNHQWQDNLETSLEELQQLLDIERISQEYLSGITQLILIPHRHLHLLPLHHLFKQPDLKITYLPSAQIGIKLSNVKIAATTLLSVENPRGDMLYATIESGVINQKYQEKNQHLKSQAATRDSVINALKKSADIFHFTGHGAHNLKHPRESALELANNELLTLADVFEIDFSRYSVICLSACETGLTSVEDLIDEYVG